MKVLASNAGMHRMINHPPKGKGRGQCVNAPDGVALGHEMLGEREAVREAFARMHARAVAENVAAYLQAADLGLARVGASGS